MTEVVHRLDLAGFLREDDKRRATLEEIEEIVIHRNTVSEIRAQSHPHEDIDDVVRTWRWLREPDDGYTKAGRLFWYHFFIDDGRVTQVHSLDTVAHHAAGRNSKSIGVALNVDGREEAPSIEMEAATILLLAALLRHCPYARIMPHNPVKQCPGGKVPIDRMRESAQNIAGAIQAETLAQICVAREW